MMQQTASFRYQKGSGFQAIQMPYDDGRFSLHLLLPDHGANLRAFAAQHLASTTSWDGYLSRFRDGEGRAEVAPVQDRLQRGRASAAATSAGHEGRLRGGCRLPPDGLPQAFIGSVRHKTTLVVDESGSEATAATVVLMAPGGAAPLPETIVPFVRRSSLRLRHPRQRNWGALVRGADRPSPETV